jgi:alginate production protein
MDGVRLSYAFANAEVMVAASRKNTIEILRGGEDDKADYYQLWLNHAPGEDALLSAYAIVRHDREGRREDPVFYGLHGERPLAGGMAYWLQLAHAAGTGAEGRISASGLDAGLTWEFDRPAFTPSLVLAYAYGSGDGDPRDGVDRNFRQTGLQDNESKLSGLVSVEYYGVLLQPELSNLHIVTAGMGIRPKDNLSLELLYHRYRQDKVSAAIRDAEVAMSPNGLSDDLGWEIDLVGGYKNKQIKAELAIGYFQPGAAFAGGVADPALFTEFTIEYEF